MWEKAGMDDAGSNLMSARLVGVGVNGPWMPVTRSAALPLAEGGSGSISRKEVSATGIKTTVSAGSRHLDASSHVKERATQNFAVRRFVRLGRTLFANETAGGQAEISPAAGHSPGIGSIPMLHNSTRVL